MTPPRTLATVLLEIEGYPSRHALYLPRKRRWSAMDEVMVLDPEDAPIEEDPPVPARARSRGLEYALGVSQAQGVVRNVFAQLPGANEDDLVRALNHYYDNDAFMELGPAADAKASRRAPPSLGPSAKKASSAKKPRKRRTT